MRGIVLCITLILFSHSFLRAQDFRLSQFYNAPLLLNPAMAGDHQYDYRMNANYKNQWQAISNAYRTMAGSYDMPMGGDVAGMSKLGIGISFLSDKAGSTNYGFTNVNLSLAYHLKTDRYSQLSAGILLGYGQSSVDLNDVKWESQHNGNNHDPSAASGESAFVEQIRYFDTGLGLMWSHYDPDYDRRFEFGLSAMHLNFPNHSFKAQYADRLQPKFQLHAGVDIGMQGFTLKPKLQVLKQGPSYLFNIGSLMSFRLGDQADSRFTDAFTSSYFDLGLFYRFNESIMVTTQYEFRRHLLLALSYDFIISELSSITRSGGFEIALRYQGKFQNQRIKIRNKVYKDDKDKTKQKRKKNDTNIRM